MKIGSSCFIRKILVWSKRERPAGTTPSRCFPNHSPCFIPKCEFSVYSKDYHDPSCLSMSMDKQEFQFCYLFFFFLPKSVSPLVSESIQKTMLCFGKNLILIMFVVQGAVAGLAMSLKWQFVGNLNQHVDQGNLEITMPPQWLYNIHLRWQTIISVWNGGIIAGRENDSIVPVESLSKKIISFLYS